jgi:hypothetical protein
VARATLRAAAVAASLAIVVSSAVACSRLRTVGLAAMSDRVDLVLDKATYAPGETIQVTYTHPVPLDAGASSYWLTISLRGAPDSDWGAWHFVPGGAAIDQLAAPTAGSYEVRLHDGYPAVPYHVVARVPVTVR